MKHIIFYFLIIFILVMPFGYASLINGLVSYYQFENNAYDLSGNNNDGTEKNGVSYGAGLFGQAAIFDGVDDYISLGSNGYNLTKGSISVWFKNDPNITSRNIFTQYYNDHNRLKIFSGDMIRGYSGYSSNYFNLTRDFVDIGLEKTEWTHVVLTYDFDLAQYSLYTNGVQIDTANNSITGPASIGELLIGVNKDFDYSGTDYGNFYKGSIDEFRIYNRVLSNSEIQELSSIPEVSSVFLCLIGILSVLRLYLIESKLPKLI